MAMEHPAQMRGRSLAVGSAQISLVCLSLLWDVGACALNSQILPAAGAQYNIAQSQTSRESSSSQKAHRKPSRPTTVPDETGPDPELSKAEELIQKQDYAGAEPLLRKVVADDPENYVAWFDLGFLENALGKPEDSIAAYRKSVAAKPDVFESNLNLGLQLAKSGNPEAER